MIKGTNPQFSKKCLPDKLMIRLAFNIFPGGQTFFHKIARSILETTCDKSDNSIKLMKQQARDKNHSHLDKAHHAILATTEDQEETLAAPSSIRHQTTIAKGSMATRKRNTLVSKNNNYN